MTPRGNLICTVGTSLFYPNLDKLDPDTRSPGTSTQGDLASVREIELRQIKKAYREKDWSRLADRLIHLPPDQRLLGAEINSVEAMVRKGFLPQDRHRLVLLVSETPDGAAIGNVLRHYFLHPRCSVRFEDCLVETVQGLQDKEPPVFQKDGLPNLVRLLGDHFRRWGGEIAINATGGYKAQIAVSVVFGQAVGVPVYYKHERFDQIIRFPQIPFTLDLSLVKNNLKLWADLAEPGASFVQEEIDSRLPREEHRREALLPLLEFIEEGSSSLYSLSALGMVYWEAFRSLNPDAGIKPARIGQRRGCHFRDDHYPEGFKQYVEKFYNAFPEFVSECHSLPYDRNAAIRPRFYARERRIIGEYQDRHRFGARFEILTPATNELERNWLLGEFGKFLQNT